MADKAIKVAVLEGDFASLCALGFPLPLSLQLQQSCLRLNEAMWTARSTNGGFSVSFFWPASDLKSQVQPKKKRKRRRAKAKKMVSTVTESTYKPAPEPSKLSPGAIITSGPTLAPNKATQGVKPAPSATCSPPCTLYDEKESCLQYSDSEKDQWTQVTGRRRRRARLPPCWKMRFPVHLRASLHTPTSSPATEESSEGEESEDANDGKGPQCARGSESTPVAARTRSKHKT